MIETLLAAATWKELLALILGAAVFILPIITAIYKYMSGPNRSSNWDNKFNKLTNDTRNDLVQETTLLKEEISALKVEITLLKSKIVDIDEEFEEVYEAQKELDNRVLQKMDKIEDKLDKFLDVLIQHMKSK